MVPTTQSPQQLPGEIENLNVVVIHVILGEVGHHSRLNWHTPEPILIKRVRCHRPMKVDEWLLYDQTSPSASGARGLSTARVFAQDGTLVATVAQEGLIRPVQPKP